MSDKALVFIWTLWFLFACLAATYWWDVNKYEQVTARMTCVGSQFCK